MFQMADWIDKQLQSAPPPATLIHLGAGSCRELSTYLAHQPRKICLVEPNPELLPGLRRRVEGHSDVHILPVAVSGQEGRRALRVFNEPDLSSLRQPTGLIESMPGLRETGQAMVEVMAAEQLPKAFNLHNDENNWLIIDTPGEEAIIIEALARHDQLYHFDHIILRAGNSSLYEGALSALELVQRMKHLGYTDEGRADDSDSDWVQQQFRLNLKALECRRLRREKEKLEEEFSARLENLNKENQALKVKHQKANANLEKKLKEDQEARADLERQLRDAQKSAKAEQRSLAEDLKKELQAAHDELHQRRSDLSVALRLQVQRENDLQELQHRYGEMQEMNRQQRELLGKLYQRLSAAAEYLQLTGNQADEHAELPEGLVQALSGEHKPRD